MELNKELSDFARKVELAKAVKGQIDLKNSYTKLEEKYAKLKEFYKKYGALVQIEKLKDFYNERGYNFQTNMKLVSLLNGDKLILDCLQVIQTAFSLNATCLNYHYFNEKNLSILKDNLSKFDRILSEKPNNTGKFIAVFFLDNDMDKAQVRSEIRKEIQGSCVKAQVQIDLYYKSETDIYTGLTLQ